MTRIVSAEAVITAKDATGGAFAAVSKKLADVSKSGKLVNDAMSGMGKTIGMMNSKLAAIQNFSGLRSGLVDARTKFRATQNEVERLGKAIAGAGTPTRELTRQMASAQRAVSAASAAYKQQAAAVIAAKNAMTGAGVPVSAMAREQTRLKARIEGATAAMARQTQQVRTLDREAGRNGGRSGSGSHVGGGGHGAGIVVGAHAAKSVIGHGIHAANDLGAAENNLRAAGMSEDEVRHVVRRSAELSAKYPSISQAQIIDTVRSQRTVTGSTEHALESIEDNVRLRAVAQMKKPGEDVSHGIELLNKAMEIKGATATPEQHHRYMNYIAKSLNTFGNTLSFEDIADSIKYSKGASFNLSEGFFSGILPTIASELGGSGAGTALATTNQAVVNGKMTHAAAVAMNDYGLIDKGSVIKTKTGSIKGVKAGGVMGSETFQRDPFEWVNEYLRPALEAKGIGPDDHLKQSQAIGSMFSNRNAAQFISILLQQASRLEKDRKLSQDAEGLDSADKNKVRDSGTAIQGLSTSLENLSATLTGPVLTQAIPAINLLSGALNDLSQWGQKNPAAAGAAGVATVGGIAYGAAKGTQWLLGSVGRALGFGGEAGAATAAGGAVGAEGAGAAGAAGGGVLSWLRGGPDLYGPKGPIKAVGGGLGISAGEVGAVGGKLFGVLGFLYEMQQQLEKKHPTNATNWASRWDPEMQGVYERSWRAQKDLHQGADMEGERGRAMGRRDYTASQVEVSGQATVRLDINVNASPELRATADAARSATVMLRGNGAGSVGTSRLEAAAPVHNIGRGDR